MSTPDVGANPLGLTSLEIATGVVFGQGTPAEIRATPGLTPLRALEEAIRPALLRPPCLVSFSGGRDSSAILAVAVALARREELPLPVPATNVFPEAAASREDPWQELVVSYLGLDDWLRLKHTDELDAVGPVAQEGLRRHGLLWPCNVHFHRPLLSAAGKGSLLTGIGGDEVFGRSRWQRALSVLTRRARPEARDVLRVGLALAPPRARTLVLRRRARIDLPWLVPEASRAAADAWARLEAAEPLRPRARLAWWRSLAHVRLGVESLARLAGDTGTLLAHPFADSAFLGAFAVAAPSDGFRQRRDAMEAVLGPLLPERLYERATKVHFDEVFWNRHSRALADDWDGEGMPAEVDAEALRAVWSRQTGDAHTLTLLQWLWVMRERARNGLGGSGSDVEQAAGSALE